MLRMKNYSVVATIASQFADPGVDVLWQKLAGMVGSIYSELIGNIGERKGVIPPERVHYLSEIASTVREYHAANSEMSEKLRLVQHLETAKVELPSISKNVDEHIEQLQEEIAEARANCWFQRTGNTILHWRIHVLCSWKTIHCFNGYRIIVPSDDT